MNLNEAEAKKLFKNHGIDVLPAMIANTPEQAMEHAKKFHPKGPWYVKVLINAGGRGLAGGVIKCNTLEEVHKNSKNFLGKPFVTKQTGPKGLMVNQVYIEKATDLLDQFYLSLNLNRDKATIDLIASKKGGVHIEEEDDFLKFSIHPLLKVQNFHSRTLDNYLGVSTGDLLPKLFDFLEKEDATLVEINPLGYTQEKKIIALDAKVSIDQNSLYRHDLSLPEKEFEYVKLEGNIGCLVNGAGLAMSMVDILDFYGGKAANFLDIGGMGFYERVLKALKMVTSDPAVKVMIVCVFGGMVDCNLYAKAILEVQQETNIPMVVRLIGTNHEQALDSLAKSGRKVQVTLDLGVLAKTAINLAKEKK